MKVKLNIQMSRVNFDKQYHLIMLNDYLNVSADSVKSLVCEQFSSQQKCYTNSYSFSVVPWCLKVKFWPYGLNVVPLCFVRDGTSIIGCPRSHVVNLSLIQSAIRVDLKSANVVFLLKCMIKQKTATIVMYLK